MNEHCVARRSRPPAPSRPSVCSADDGRMVHTESLERRRESSVLLHVGPGIDVLLGRWRFVVFASGYNAAAVDVANEGVVVWVRDVRCNDRVVVRRRRKRVPNGFHHVMNGESPTRGRTCRYCAPASRTLEHTTAAGRPRSHCVRRPPRRAFVALWRRVDSVALRGSQCSVFGMGPAPSVCRDTPETGARTAWPPVKSFKSDAEMRRRRRRFFRTPSHTRQGSILVAGFIVASRWAMTRRGKLSLERQCSRRACVTCCTWGVSRCLT